MGMLAARVTEMIESSSWIRRMYEEGNRLRRLHGADAVFDFSMGNPHLEPPARVLERYAAIAADRAPGMHRYMPAPGFPAVRSRIAQWLSQQEGLPLEARHVIVTGGAACGMNVALHTMLDAGDGVVLVAPYFAEYPAYIRHAQGRVQIVESTADFDLDIDQIVDVLDETTRVVILNAPNNPTGRVYSAARLAELASALLDAGNRFGNPIALLGDDVYRRMNFVGSTPSYLTLYPHSVSVGSFSKDLGLAGERIGYLAANPAAANADGFLAGAEMNLRTLGFVNANATMQRVVAECLDVPVPVTDYAANRNHLCACLTQIGYELVPPEGGLFLFPKAPTRDDEAFVAALLAERILVVPGMGFGRRGHFRLTLAVDPQTIDRSIPGFARVWKKFCG